MRPTVTSCTGFWTGASELFNKIVFTDWFLLLLHHSCLTQKTTSILGRSGTAIAPPCWPPSRSTVTLPSTWASWETSMALHPPNSLHPSPPLFFFSPAANFKPTPDVCSSVSFWPMCVRACVLPSAPMTCSTLWMKASAVLTSSSPQEVCPWERRWVTGEDPNAFISCSVFYCHLVSKSGFTSYFQD